MIKVWLTYKFEKNKKKYFIWLGEKNRRKSYMLPPIWRNKKQIMKMFRPILSQDEQNWQKHALLKKRKCLHLADENFYLTVKITWTFLKFPPPTLIISCPPWMCLTCCGCAFRSTTGCKCTGKSYSLIPPQKSNGSSQTLDLPTLSMIEN